MKKTSSNKFTFSIIVSNLIFGTVLFANSNGFNETPAVHNMNEDVKQEGTTAVSTNYDYKIEEKNTNEIKTVPLVLNQEVKTEVPIASIEPNNPVVPMESVTPLPLDEPKKITAENVSDSNKDILELLEIANQKKLEYDEKRQRAEEERLKQDKDYIIKEKILEIQQIKAEMDLQKMKMDLDLLNKSAIRENELLNSEKSKLVVEAELQLATLKDKYASIDDDVTIIGKYGYYKFGDKEVYQVPTAYLYKAQEKLKELSNMKNTLTESIVYYTKFLENKEEDVEVLKNNIRMKKIDLIPEERMMMNSVQDEKLEITEGFIFNNLIITKVTKNSFTAKIIE